MSEKLEGYKSAFEAFKQRFLIEKKSIFNLDDDEEILTRESINYLIEKFIKKPYEGNASFLEKIEHQLIPKLEGSDAPVVKNAIEILATAVWLWRLPPLNTTQNGRKKSVVEVLKLDKSFKSSILDNNIYLGSKIKGFAKPGTLYNTSKPGQLIYIINFLDKYLEIKKLDAVEILEDMAGEIEVAATVGSVSKEKSVVEYPSTKSTGAPKKYSVSIHNALLHLFKPDYYEPILSMSHKGRIISAYEDKLEEINDNATEDEKLDKIRLKLGINTGYFYKTEFREHWDPTALPAKNVIYYGAPGTGKTYQVTKLVKNKVNKDDALYKTQQFHPSFSYEDFIDGVKPDCIGDGGMKFTLVNGVFKELCIRAFMELVRVKQDNNGKKTKDKKEPKAFYFIADEINRAELSRVFGELLLCLEEDKRLRFDEKGNLQGIKIKTQNSQLWKKEHAVVVMTGDEVASVYEKDKTVYWTDEGDEYYFGVPENLYFLGTMNDIDRSIDSFDLALRRRFKWVHKACDYDVIADALVENDANDETIVEYLSDGKEKGAVKGRCLLLNEFISNTLNLGASYELGHSYYMKINLLNGKISKAAYERLFDYELAPLLAEYLRAEYASGRDLEGKLKEMRALFVEGKSK